MRRVVILAIATLCTVACGKSPEERVAEAAIKAASGHDVEIDQDGGQLTLKTGQGEMRVSGGDAAALPASFPKDVHLPAGYAVNSAMEMPNVTQVELDVPGEVPAVFDAYSRAMQAQGWQQTMAVQEVADTRMLGFEKGGRQALVSVYDQGQGVKVGVQLTGKQ